MPLEFRKTWDGFCPTQGLLVVFNLKQLFFLSLSQSPGLFNTLQDRDGATKRACGFKLFDRSRDFISDFFFSLPSAPQRTHFRVEIHDVFILNSLAVVELAIWKGDVSQGQGWLLVEGSYLSLPSAKHTHNSLRKSSFMVPELLFGWLNSFSSADI